MPNLLPELDPTSAIAVSEQIALYYERAIEDGQVQPGDRLPPIRSVASACHVTRATVQEAYRRLAERGLVEGTVGRGTIVLARLDVGATSDAGHLSPYAEAALRRT
ncbi:MAG: winged helix-turn-helix transcriptional regulator, partial [Planctomycetes bacterium]|nr:winged helix-turn-helix transcriptional regulator [Planctomycetota bacterium]